MYYFFIFYERTIIEKYKNNFNVYTGKKEMMKYQITLRRDVRKYATAWLATGPFVKTPVYVFAIYVSVLAYLISFIHKMNL